LGEQEPRSLNHGASCRFSLSSRRKREERVGERRNFLFGDPSLRLSPRSCLTGRERKKATSESSSRVGKTRLGLGLGASLEFGAWDLEL
jgi:hypothetical protein